MRVQEDEAVRGDLGDMDDGRLRRGAGTVEMAAPRREVAVRRGRQRRRRRGDPAVREEGEGFVERMDVAEQVVEGVEPDVEPLRAAAGGRPRVVAARDGRAVAVVDAAARARPGVSARRRRPLPEPDDRRVLVAPGQRRQRREVALLGACLICLLSQQTQTKACETMLPAA